MSDDDYDPSTRWKAIQDAIAGVLASAGPTPDGLIPHAAIINSLDDDTECMWATVRFFLRLPDGTEPELEDYRVDNVDEDNLGPLKLAVDDLWQPAVIAAEMEQLTGKGS